MWSGALDTVDGMLDGEGELCVPCVHSESCQIVLEGVMGLLMCNSE